MALRLVLPSRTTQGKPGYRSFLSNLSHLIKKAKLPGNPPDELQDLLKKVD